MIARSAKSTKRIRQKRRAVTPMGTYALAALGAVRCKRTFRRSDAEHDGEGARVGCNTIKGAQDGFSVPQ